MAVSQVMTVDNKRDYLQLVEMLDIIGNYQPTFLAGVIRTVSDAGLPVEVDGDTHEVIDYDILISTPQSDYTKQTLHDGLYGWYLEHCADSGMTTAEIEHKVQTFLCHYCRIVDTHLMVTDLYNDTPSTRQFRSAAAYLQETHSMILGMNTHKDKG